MIENALVAGFRAAVTAMLLPAIIAGQITKNVQEGKLSPARIMGNMINVATTAFAIGLIIYAELRKEHGDR